MFFLYIKLKNKYYQKQNERLRKEAREKDQNLPKEERTKGKKKPNKDIKILQKKKQKKSQYVLNFANIAL